MNCNETILAQPIASGHTVVTGKILYQDFNGHFHPVRSATVQLFDQFSASPYQIGKSYATSDPTGTFTSDAFSSTRTDNKTPVKILVVVSAASANLQVGDYVPASINIPALSVVSQTPYAAPPGRTVSISCTVPSSFAHDPTLKVVRDDNYRAFPTYDALVQGMDFYTANVVQYAAIPTINAQLDDSVTSQTGRTNPYAMAINRDDSWDWDVILHEFSHVIQAQVGLAAPGGDHACSSNLTGQNHSSRAVALGIAWGEGFATFSAIAIEQLQGVPAVGQGVGDTAYDDYLLKSTPAPPVMLLATRVDLAQQGTPVGCTTRTTPALPLAVGEDSEFSVARMLWQLFSFEGINVSNYQRMLSTLKAHKGDPQNLSAQLPYLMQDAVAAPLNIAAAKSASAQRLDQTFKLTCTSWGDPSGVGILPKIDNVTGGTDAATPPSIEWTPPLSAVVTGGWGRPLFNQYQAAFFAMSTQNSPSASTTTWLYTSPQQSLDKKGEKQTYAIPQSDWTSVLNAKDRTGSTPKQLGVVLVATNTHDPTPIGEYWSCPTPLARPRVQLTFVIDATDSMLLLQNPLQQLQQAISPIIADLQSSGVDYSVGLVDYREYSTQAGCVTYQAPYAHVDLAMTPSASVLDLQNGFVNATRGLGTCDAPENPFVLSGLEAAIHGMRWDPGAKHVIVSIGDVAGQSPEPLTQYTLAQVISDAQGTPVAAGSRPALAWNGTACSCSAAAAATPSSGPIEIFPVSVFADPTMDQWANTLASGTGGQVLPLGPLQTLLPQIINAVNAAPYADAGGPYTGTLAGPVAFDASQSAAYGGASIAKYEWDYLDNGNFVAAAGPTVTHTYTAPYDGLAILRITDSNGATWLGAAHVTVTGPVAVPGGPYVGGATTPIHFDASKSSTSIGTIVKYEWDFWNNGTWVTAPGPTITYTYHGAYFGPAILRVTDSNGFQATAAANVSVADFLVNTTADTDDAHLHDGVCADSTGKCSLRAAIDELNSGCACLGTPTVGLLPGTYTLTSGNELEVLRPMTIQGSGAFKTTVNLNGARFHVGNGQFGGGNINTQLTLTDMAITGSGGIPVYADYLSGVSVYDSLITNNGGGVGAYEGNMNVVRTIITGNHGTGIYGIGRLWVDSSTISNNVGGGIGGDQQGGDLAVYQLSNSVISGNIYGGNGGGISLPNSSFIYADHTAIVNNTAATNGGGIALGNVGSSNFSDMTIAGNTATSGDGGGIYTVAGSQNWNALTIAHNTSHGPTGGVDAVAPVSVANTLIAANSGADCNGTITSSGYSLADDTSCNGFTASSDQQNTNAHLGAVGLYGGSRPVVLPIGPSGVIDAIPFTGGDDERNVPRGIDGNGDGVGYSDIGAAEYTGPAITTGNYTGAIGAQVLISGTRLGDTTTVTLGTTNVSFQVLGDTGIIITVPAGATTATLTITAPEGSWQTPFSVT